MEPAASLSAREPSHHKGISGPEVPLEVFYVVHSIGRPGERQHEVRSILYQNKRDADAELARLRASDPAGTYEVRHAATYIEPAAWLYDVLLTDGTVVHPARR